jgi:hypothetical protein
MKVGDVVSRTAEPDKTGKVVAIELDQYGSTHDLAHVVWDYSPNITIGIPRFKWDWFTIHLPEQPRTESAKFGGDPICEFLYILSLEGFADEESGHCEAPTGWFARFSIADWDLEELVKSHKEEIDELGFTDARALVGHWLITNDEQGFVHLESFDTEKALKARFDELDAEYSKWDNDEI